MNAASDLYQDCIINVEASDIKFSGHHTAIYNDFTPSGKLSTPSPSIRPDTENTSAQSKRLIMGHPLKKPHGLGVLRPHICSTR
jgi:hypothetical protein